MADRRGQRLLLGLDLGTGSAKALLLTEGGQVVGQGSASYAVESPHPGWAETPPEAWWRGMGEAVRQAVGGHGGQVAALGLSGQMHGVVVCGEDGAGLRPAILWADTRSAPLLSRYRALGPAARHALANPYVAGMAGPTLLWLHDHEPAVYRQARWALQPKDWLRHQLTGRIATEPSDASATLLYDLPADAWARDIVAALGLRPELLPPIIPSAALAGHLTAGAATHLGLPSGLPIAAGAADTAAAALGTGLLEPGPTQLTVGTGGQLISVLVSSQSDAATRTHLYRAAMPERWYAMAAIQNAGLALEWARRVLGVDWETAYAEAFAVSAGAGGLTFLPYLTGERTPHLAPDLRGAWIGLDLHHARPHLLRAAFEGVAFALREGLEALEARGIQAPDLRLAGGGTIEPRWRQMLADILARPLLAVPEPAASSRGAALLAGISAGVYAGYNDIQRLAPDPQPAAQPENSAQYTDAYQRYRDLAQRMLA